MNVSVSTALVNSEFSYTTHNTIKRTSTELIQSQTCDRRLTVDENSNTQVDVVEVIRYALQNCKTTTIRTYEKSVDDCGFLIANN